MFSLGELKIRADDGLISEIEKDIIRESNEKYSLFDPIDGIQDKEIFNKFFQTYEKEVAKETHDVGLPTYYLELDSFITHHWIYRSRQYRCLWLVKLAERNGIKFEDVLADCKRHPRFRFEAGMKKDFKKDLEESLDNIIKDKDIDPERINSAKRLKADGYKGFYSVVGFNALRKRLNVIGPPKVKEPIINDILLMHKEIQSPLGDREALYPYAPNLSALKKMFEQEGGIKEIWYIYGSLASSINYFNKKRTIEPDDDLEVNIFLSAVDRATNLMSREQVYTLLMYLYDEYSNDQQWQSKWEKYSVTDDVNLPDNVRFAEDRTHRVKMDPIDLFLLISKGLYNIQEYRKNPIYCYDAYIQYHYFYGSSTINDDIHFTEKEFQLLTE